MFRGFRRRRFTDIVMEVNLAALRANLAGVRARTGTRVCAMVKADAYGYGAAETARALSDKSDFFGVATGEEALALREAGIKNDILVCSKPDPALAAELTRQGVTHCLLDADDVRMLISAGKGGKRLPKAHIKLDTGMHRLGLQTREELLALIDAAAGKIDITGIIHALCDQ